MIPDGPVPMSDDPDELATLTLAELAKPERDAVLERAAHIREVLTGYRSGSAELAGEGEPRAQFDPGLPLTRRYESKAAELGVSLRTVKQWVADFRQRGEAGLARMARFTYLDPRARDFFTDWNRTAKECVAALRTQAGRDPLDRDLSALIGELSTQSEEFAALWATHDVRLHRKTEKSFNHPVAGDLTLRYERLAVDGDPGLGIYAYIAEPGSRSAEAFNFLASYSGGRDLPSRSSVKKDA